LTITDVSQSLPRTAPWPKRKCRITHVIIHHTAATTDVSPETVAAWHMDPGRHLVMPGIAYHYYIRQDGTVYQCNPDDARSWHAGNGQAGCANPNEFGIAVCLSGSFMGRVPSEVQIEAARGVVAHIWAEHGQLTVIGHQDVAPTACPGDTFLAWKDKIQPGRSNPDLRQAAWGSQASWPEFVKERARLTQLGAPMGSSTTIQGETVYPFALGLIVTQGSRVLRELPW